VKPSSQKKNRKPGRPKAEYEIGRGTYSLPAKLIDLVEDYSFQESLSRSDVVSLSLIEFFAGKSVRPKPKRQSLTEIAKKKRLKL